MLMDFSGCLMELNLTITGFDPSKLNVHGNFCSGLGLITWKKCLHSLILRLALPIVISNTLLLLRYERKNILTRSWCYVVARLIGISNTLLLLRYQQNIILIRSWCYVVALPIVINFQHALDSWFACEAEKHQRRHPRRDLGFCYVLLVKTYPQCW